MAYTIIKTNGAVLTTIADGTVNTTSSSLSLPGRNYAGYGVVMDTNLVHLLENFSDSVVPANPIKGQLWYNTTNQSMYVCPTDGETDVNNWFKIITTNDDIATLYNLTLSGNLISSNAYISGNLTSNTITANYLTVNDDANLLGTSVISDITTNSISSGVTTATITGNYNATGNWNITGNLSASKVKTDYYLYSNGDPLSFYTIAGSNYQLQYNISNDFAASSALTFDPSSNILAVIGNVSATQLIGNGLGITNSNAGNLTGTIASAVQSNITSIGTLPSLTVTGNVTSGNANLGNLVTANFVAGTLTTASQPNITYLGTLTGLNSTGTVNLTNASNVSLGPIANVHITGGSSGYVLTTNGSGDLSWTAQGSLSITASGSNTQVQYNNSGNLGASANFTFNSSTNILTVTGNINSTNANLGNAVTANYFIGSGYNLANIWGPNVLGFVPNAVVANTVRNGAQPNITSVSTLTQLDVNARVNASGYTSNVATGTPPLTVSSTTRVANLNVSYANVSDFISVSAPGTGTAYIVGANATTGNVTEYTSSGISMNLSNNAITATTFIGTLSGAATTAGTVTTAAQPNITSVGVLKDTLIGSSNSLSGANLISAAYLNGTLLESNQPYITKVGTLSNLSVTGNITSGNANLGNLATANYFSGNGSALTGVTATNGVKVNQVGSPVTMNLTGTVGPVAGTGTIKTIYSGPSYDTNTNVLSVNIDGLASSATTALSAGTVTSSAQPNITSVGSSLTVSGNITTGNANLGNLVTANYFSGNGSALTNVTATNGVRVLAGDGYTTMALTGVVGSVSPTGTTKTIYAGVSYDQSTNTLSASITGSAVSAGTAGTVTTAAQPNITSVGSSLTVNGPVSATSYSGSGAGLTSINGGNVSKVANATYADSAGALSGGALVWRLVSSTNFNLGWASWNLCNFAAIPEDFASYLIQVTWAYNGAYPSYYSGSAVIGGLVGMYNSQSATRGLGNDSLIYLGGMGAYAEVCYINTQGSGGQHGPYLYAYWAGRRGAYDGAPNTITANIKIYKLAP